MNKDAELYKQLDGAYITTYIHDRDTGYIYITCASGKKITIKDPSDIIVTKVKSVYENTGAKLKKSNKILHKGK